MSGATIFERDTRPGGTLDTVAYYILLALVFVLPFLVVPSSTAPFLSTKVAFSGLCVLLACAVFVVSRLKTQEISGPRTLVLAFAWGVPVAYLLSGLFTGGAGIGLFGERLQVDSLFFVTISVLLLTLTALLLNTKERVLGVYLALVAGGAVLALLQLLVFFAGGALSAMGLALPTLSLLGSLNDLAVLFGLLAVLSVATLTLLPLAGITRGLLWVLFVVSLFFMVVVDLQAAWWIVGLFSLGFFVYSIAGTGSKFSSERISVSALLLLVAAAFFAFGGTGVSGALAEWANVGELDVRPSWGTTINIGKESYADNLLFGSGPGSFSTLWAAHRPAEVDRTPFWAANFSFGIGLLPTSFITTGLVGLIAWAAFLIALLVAAFRVLVLARGSSRDPIAAYLRASAFTGALFLWIILFIQVPSPAIIVFAFVLTGLFIASLRFGADQVGDVTLRFKDNPRVGFMVTLVFTLVILASVAGVYGVGTRYIAEQQYQTAVAAANVRADIDESERAVNRATTLHQADTYYRFRSTLSLARLQRLVAENRPPEEIREQFQALLSGAIADAQQATVLDEDDYQNWVQLGTVYQSIVPLGIEGAAGSAQQAFDRALELRPESPAILLAKATVARQAGDLGGARELVTRAISARNQYTDAIFLLAQLQIENNEIEEAIRSVEATTVFEPNNPVAFFQLGLLAYSAGDQTRAVNAFERAVAINSEYANARYFLGLVYAQQGRREAALEQFLTVQKTNPENAELAQVIANLQAGRDPFPAEAQPTPIEQLDAPPVEDTDTEAEASSDETPALTQ